MSNLLIRHVPDDTIRLAKKLAVRHRHSLQEEISNILVEAVQFRSGKWSGQADTIRKRLSKNKKPYSDTVDLLRKDRER